MSTEALITGQGDRRQTLVTVFLRGGADGLTLVAPVQDDSYYRARPRLGLDRKSVLPLAGPFGLHPLLRGLEPAWKEGELAIIHAAGSADESRSHFQAQDFMEHGGPAGGGWMGRFLRALPPAGQGALAGVAIGRLLPESLAGAPTAAVLEKLEDFSFGGAAGGFQRELKALYALEPGALGQAARETFSVLEQLEALRAKPYAPAHGARYANDEFALGLRELARLIKARVGLEAAAIDLGGWDSHFTQETLLNPLLTRLGQGLAAFRQDLGAHMSEVTVVVMTEFGRRVMENSAFGTDHGRGSVMWVLGGGVRGGRMHGAWPGLEEGSLVGPGDVPVANDYRQVLLPVLRRHGLPADGVTQVFPGFAGESLGLFGEG